MKNINKIIDKFGIKRKDVIPYGEYFAKICARSQKRKGKLILVTAMTSNRTGIGKTTVSIGLADALNKLGQTTILALREPSMGPVFGVKGGATGGGRSSIVPSNEINLHFTGDFHAIAQANNLLSSIIDNHIFFGNELKIDTTKIVFKRCLDINERSLREITYEIKGQKITTGFNITAASEIMAIMCLSKNMAELKENLGNILVALNVDGNPIFAKDLKAEDAMAILLKDAFMPNIAQTLEGSMALVHLGPFANIAHGCNSVIATEIALSNAKYCVTEAGFGSDLGAEKFIDIKCRVLNKVPDMVVLVIVNKVVKEHGAGDIIRGFENVKKHIENIKNQFRLPMVVAINQHADDNSQDINTLIDLCNREGVIASVCSGFDNGSEGCIDLAKKIQSLPLVDCAQFSYFMEDDIKVKIEKIATKIYGAKSVEYSDTAEEKIKLAKSLGFNKFFVNIAKTQFSFSDKKELLGAPKDFVFKVTDIEIRSGAKMIVAIAGDMLLMPGLARASNYLNMRIDTNGNIFEIV